MALVFAPTPGSPKAREHFQGCASTATVNNVVVRARLRRVHQERSDTFVCLRVAGLSRANLTPYLSSLRGRSVPGVGYVSVLADSCLSPLAFLRFVWCGTRVFTSVLRFEVSTNVRKQCVGLQCFAEGIAAVFRYGGRWWWRRCCGRSTGTWWKT